MERPRTAGFQQQVRNSSSNQQAPARRHLRSYIPSAPADPMLEKYNQQYAAAKDKPEDFTGWTSLLSTADKLVRSGSAVV
jgi:hypothetical protein